MDCRASRLRATLITGGSSRRSKLRWAATMRRREAAACPAPVIAPPSDRCLGASPQVATHHPRATRVWVDTLGGDRDLRARHAINLMSTAPRKRTHIRRHRAYPPAPPPRLTTFPFREEVTACTPSHPAIDHRRKLGRLVALAVQFKRRRQAPARRLDRRQCPFSAMGNTFIHLITLPAQLLLLPFRPSSRRRRHRLHMQHRCPPRRLARSLPMPRGLLVASRRARQRRTTRANAARRLKSSSRQSIV